MNLISRQMFKQRHGWQPAAPAGVVARNFHKWRTGSSKGGWRLHVMNWTSGFSVGGCLALAQIPSHQSVSEASRTARKFASGQTYVACDDA